jgi:hypothetical protein
MSDGARWAWRPQEDPQQALMRIWLTPRFRTIQRDSYLTARSEQGPLRHLMQIDFTHDRCNKIKHLAWSRKRFRRFRDREHC